MTRRPTAGLFLASAVALLAAGCGGDDAGDTMKLTGDCGLGDSKIAVTRVLPTSVLEKLVPYGEYSAAGGLVVKDGRLPAAYDGNCELQDTDGQDALRLALIHRGDPRYAQAQQALAAGDQDEFVKLDDTSYAFQDSAGDPRGVTVLPDRVVILQVLEPKSGVGVEEVGDQMKPLSDRVQSLS
jgi:hypothetical protein